MAFADPCHYAPAHTGCLALKDTIPIAATILGAVLGAVLAWLFLRQRTAAAVAESEARLHSAHADEKLGLSKNLATAEANDSAARARVADLQREAGERERALDELRRA